MAKKAKTKKTAKKAAKKANATTTNTAPAAMSPAAFVFTPNHDEKRYPGSDDQHDILCRWIDGQGTVCKIVPKGGSWDDAP
jgi:hypothetical protein